jgi:hypothetical protein
MHFISSVSSTDRNRAMALRFTWTSSRCWWIALFLRGCVNVTCLLKSRLDREAAASNGLPSVKSMSLTWMPP